MITILSAMLRSFFLSVQGSLRQAGIIVLALAAALGLAGCSAMRVAYGQGHHLAYWWLDRYFDFTEEQAPRVRQGLQAWFDWHRQSQLEDYAGLLADMRKAAGGDLSADQVCAIGEQMRQRLEPALQRILPVAAEIAPTLSAEQITQLRKRNAKTIADARKDYLQADADKRRQAAFERTVERFEDFYGRLDDAQRALITERLAKSPFEPEVWLRDREARHQQIVATLQRLSSERADAARALPALRALAERWQQPPSAEAQARQQRLIAYNCDFTAALHNLTTPAQRARAQEKLKGWEDDLRVLAGVAGVRPAAVNAR
jgi:hypothetical protein